MDNETEDSQPRRRSQARRRKGVRLDENGKPTISARNRVMDLLARRNHSERELRQKLGEDYPSEEVDAAIEFARESKWLLPAEELSAAVARSLGNRRKGHRFINQYLKNKGLPPVAKDLDREFEKACELAKSRLSRSVSMARPTSPEGRQRLYRLLANRGFDDETIRKTIDWAAREFA